MKYNLFSIPYALKHGCKAEIKEGSIIISKSRFKLKFDRKVRSGSSYLMCAKMIPEDGDRTNEVNLMTKNMDHSNTYEKCIEH